MMHENDIWFLFYRKCKFIWKQISGPETDAQPSFAIVHSMSAANGSGISLNNVNKV